MTRIDGQDASARLLTPKEAAAFLRLNPRTVTRLARVGTLPAIRIGRRWRFRPEALEYWTTTREVAPFYGRALHSQAEGFALSYLVSAETVMVDLEASGMPEALEKIVEVLEERGVLSEGKLFLKMLIEREELMSTSIVEGVAVPHPRRAVQGMFERSMLAVAIAPRGVDFSATGPVRVFFVICASDDRSHLRILARLSRVLMETPIVERMLTVMCPEEVPVIMAAVEAAFTNGDRVVG